MTRLTRRDFLKIGITVFTAGALMPSFIVQAAARSALDGPSPTAAARTLIVIQMAGGNDGLNTVVPYTDPQYQRLRPTLAVPPDSVIQLDGKLGLHPSLKALKPAWDAKELAIVENVGYDHPSLSHFQAMDIWERADPTLNRRDGWLSTIVEGSGETGGGFRGLSMGPSLTPTFAYPPVPPPAVSNLNDYQIQPDPRYPAGRTVRDEALQKLYASYTDPAPYATVLRATSDTADATVKSLHDAAAGHQPSVTYPKGPLADGLKLLAAAIVKDVGLRAGYVIIGSFDTHADQAQHQSQLLQTLAEGVAAFQTDITAAGKADNVLLITWSEFGRRVAENAARGTDHGTAAPLFVMGKGVKGGILGDPPDLANLDNGNLRYHTDFRSVYATILEGWLQTDSTPILGQKFPKLGFL